MRKLAIRLLCRILKIRSIDLDIENYDETTTEYIESLLKRKDFVALNRKGEYLRKDFVLVRLERKEGLITKIEIKHDIDSVVNRNVNWTEITCKFLDTESYTNYFLKL